MNEERFKIALEANRKKMEESKLRAENPAKKMLAGTENEPRVKVVLGDGTTRLIRESRLPMFYAMLYDMMLIGLKPGCMDKGREFLASMYGLESVTVEELTTKDDD